MEFANPNWHEHGFIDGENAKLISNKLSLVGSMI